MSVAKLLMFLIKVGQGQRRGKLVQGKRGCMAKYFTASYWGGAEVMYPCALRTEDQEVVQSFLTLPLPTAAQGIILSAQSLCFFHCSEEASQLVALALLSTTQPSAVCRWEGLQFG